MGRQCVDERHDVKAAAESGVEGSQVGISSIDSEDGGTAIVYPGFISDSVTLCSLFSALWIALVDESQTL